MYYSKYLNINSKFFTIRKYLKTKINFKIYKINLIIIQYLSFKADISVSIVFDS